MNDKEKKRLNIPVELDEDGNFGVDSERLNESLNEKIEQLADESANRRLIIALVGQILMTLLICFLLIRGLTLLATLLIIFTIFNWKPLIKWVEKDKD